MPPLLRIFSPFAIAVMLVWGFCGDPVVPAGEIAEVKADEIGGFRGEIAVHIFVAVLYQINVSLSQAAVF